MKHSFVKGQLYQLSVNPLNKIFGWLIHSNGELYNHLGTHRGILDGTILMCMTNEVFCDDNPIIKVNQIYFLYETKIIYLSESLDQITTFLEDWERI